MIYFCTTVCMWNGDGCHLTIVISLHNLYPLLVINHSHEISLMFKFLSINGFQYVLKDKKIKQHEHIYIVKFT